MAKKKTPNIKKTVIAEKNGNSHPHPGASSQKKPAVLEVLPDGDADKELMPVGARTAVSYAQVVQPKPKVEPEVPPKIEPKVSTEEAPEKPVHGAAMQTSETLETKNSSDEKLDSVKKVLTCLFSIDPMSAKFNLSGFNGHLDKLPLSDLKLSQEKFKTIHFVLYNVLYEIDSDFKKLILENLVEPALYTQSLQRFFGSIPEWYLVESFTSMTRPIIRNLKFNGTSASRKEFDWDSKIKEFERKLDEERNSIEELLPHLPRQWHLKRYLIKRVEQDRNYLFNAVVDQLNHLGIFHNQQHYTHELLAQHVWSHVEKTLR